MRMQLMIESLAQAIERAGASGAPLNAASVAAQLEQADVTLAGQRARMRAADHQLQQPLVVAVMDKQGTPGVKFDVEGSGYGFRPMRQLSAEQAEMPHSCQMQRPAR
jgi:branched-chain amino acid transport system substrate-binding protein